MVSLAAIYADIESHDISLYHYPVGPRKAAAIELDGHYNILVDHCPTISEFKYILMHELGHCATGCTHYMHSPYQLVEQHEYRANKYAATHYLPPEKFLHAFQAGVYTPWDLAEWFGVPEAFIMQTYHYYKQNGLL